MDKSIPRPAPPTVAEFVDEAHRWILRGGNYVQASYTLVEPTDEYPRLDCKLICRRKGFRAFFAALVRGAL